MTNLEVKIQALKDAANAYGQGDNRRIVAIEVDLVNAILATRVPNSRAVEKALSNLIENYIHEIKSQWA